MTARSSSSGSRSFISRRNLAPSTSTSTSTSDPAKRRTAFTGRPL
ncbi:hypothetical protein ACFWAA_10060 [Streptomyces sp. NPDC059922]